MNWVILVEPCCPLSSPRPPSSRTPLQAPPKRSGAPTSCPADAMAPDKSGIYLDKVLRFALDPRLDPGVYDRRALSLGVHMMRRASDQHSPSHARRQIDLVDLHGDVVFGMRDTSTEVLVGEGVLGGAENDRTFVHLVLNRQRRRPIPAVIDEAPEPLDAEQPKTFSLV